MVCIYCGKETSVYNSRGRRNNPSVWRRRRCSTCVAQFTTIELPDYKTSLAIESPNSMLYPFKRDRLFLSLLKALEYRKDALDVATELTTTVIGGLLRKKKAPDGVINIRDIAQTSYAVLKRFDPPAAHTYKAFHASALE